MGKSVRWSCPAGRSLTGVHCRLTLLSSTTRIVPWVVDPVARCCKEPPAPKPPPPEACGCWSELPDVEEKREHPRGHHEPDGYDPQPDDVRFVRHYAAREAIATSSGQNDTGLFELSFRDERYLPFEFEGAVSRWRIELPPENNYFEMDTLSDVVLHLNYMAREGGDVLRRAASEAAERRVPDAGRRFFDVRQEMPGEWRRFLAGQGDRRELELRLRRDMFMFLPGRRDVWITRLEIFVEVPEARPGAHRLIELALGHKHDCDAPGRDRHEHRRDLDVECVASEAWPGTFHGAVDVTLGPIGHEEADPLATLRFGEAWDGVHRVYVVCGYEARRGRRTELLPTASSKSSPRTRSIGEDSGP
jgi:hypothetical protein